MRTTKFSMLLFMLLLTANAWGSWSYISKGNGIAAYGENGYTKDNPLTLTLTAPTDLMFNGMNKPATLTGSDAWTAAGLTLPTIYYNGLMDQPRALGDYTASISVGGVTAKCTFTIATVIEYKSIFNNGINEGTNYDIVEGTGAYTVPLNDSEKRGVYWDDDEKCAVFDGEAYLMINNPLGNANASTGFTLSIETYISSENDNRHPYINTKGNQYSGGGWQRLFDLSDGTKSNYFFLNAGVKYLSEDNTSDEGNHLMYDPCYSGSQSRVYNSTGKKFFNKWINVTLVVAPGGYGTLYVDGEKLTYNNTNYVMRYVLNNISKYDKCYIGTSIYEVIDGCDGLFKGKIRGFDIAEGALLPYFDGSSYHYLLTYDTNGGDKITGSFQSTIPSSLPTPIRTGYTFQGWYMDRNFTTAATSGTALTANTTLYAKWNSITFDETTATQADITAYKDQTTNVVIGRTFYKDGGNNTICLPFSLTADQIAASPLAGYTKLQEFSSANIVNKGEDDETLELTMTNATSIAAGKPYIIAWAKGDNLVNPAFTNVTVSTDEPSTTAKSGGVEFCGVLAPFSMEKGQQYMFVGTGAQLKWPKADGWFKGFSGYFTVDLSAGAKLFYGMDAFLVEEKDATGISSTGSDQSTAAKARKLLEQGKVVIISDGKRYTLDGKLVK